jgi:hypothetical protein
MSVAIDGGSLTQSLSTLHSPTDHNGSNTVAEKTFNARQSHLANAPTNVSLKVTTKGISVVNRVSGLVLETHLYVQMKFWSYSHEESVILLTLGAHYGKREIRYTVEPIAEDGSIPGHEICTLMRKHAEQLSKAR